MHIVEYIIDVFNVGHCEIKVKVTLALAKFNYLIFQTTRTALDCRQ